MKTQEQLKGDLSEFLVESLIDWLNTQEDEITEELLARLPDSSNPPEDAVEQIMVAITEALTTCVASNLERTLSKHCDCSLGEPTGSAILTTAQKFYDTIIETLKFYSDNKAPTFLNLGNRLN